MWWEQSSVHSTSPASRPSPDACISTFASATHILAAVTSSLDDYALSSVSHLRPIFEAVTRLTFLKHSSDALFTCTVIFNLFPRPSNRNKLPACLLHPLSHSSPHPHSRLQPSSVIIFPPHLCCLVSGVLFMLFPLAERPTPGLSCPSTT